MTTFTTITVSGLVSHLAAYHSGRDNAEAAPAIAIKLGLPDRYLRRLIREARQAGHPICGDDAGTYYGETRGEIEHLYARLMSRSNDLKDTADAIMRYLKRAHPPAQGELPL